MVCPQRRLDNTRSYSCHPDSVQLVEIGHGPHKAADSMFRSGIHRSREGCILARHTGDVEDMSGFLAVTEAQKVGNSQLGDTDGVSNIDIDQGITTLTRRILASRRTRRTPEVAPML